MADIPLGESAVCGTCGRPYKISGGHACPGPRSSARVDAIDVTAIEARALAAPACRYEAFTDKLWLDFRAPGDDDTDGHWSNSGRWVVTDDRIWHRGAEDLPPAFWAFLASARDDVLALTAEVRARDAEVRWLRSALAGVLTSPPVREAA